MCDFDGDKLCPDGLTCGSSGVCGAAGSACDACFGQPDGLLRVCLATRPTGTFLVGSDNLQIDTTPGSDSMCVAYPQPASGALGVCLVAVKTISIEGKLGVVGSRPLVLLASGTLTFDDTGAIDAAADSSRAAPAGPGGPGAGEPCVAGVAGIGNAHGGAGGSFGTAGGAGGIGVSGGTPDEAGPVTGTLDHVRAGCAGSPGSEPMTPQGAEGGAVYLIAGGSMSIAGRIDASGAGGAANSGSDVGGAGGGTGGLIGLDAPSIVFLGGALMANGGGGGCGRRLGGDNQCLGLAPTFPVSSAAPFAPAGGGSADGWDSIGGNGATDDLATPGTPGGAASDTSPFGGAGGGGGAGILWFATGGTSPDVSAIRMSPQPVTHR